MENKDFPLDHNSISLIHSFLTLNQSSEAGLVSRDFHEDSKRFLKFENKNKLNIYTVKPRKDIALIDDQNSTDEKFLQDIADKYSSFQLFPLRQTKYNLVKFDQHVDIENDLHPFYHVTREKCPENWTVEYLDFDEAFYCIEQISRTELFCNFTTSYDRKCWLRFRLTSENLNMFTVKEKFYKISYNDNGKNSYAKYVFYFNNKHVLLHIRDSDQTKTYSISIDITKIDFYIINSDSFMLVFRDKENENFVISQNPFDQVSQNFFKYEDFVLDINNREIKIISDVDSNFTIDKKKLNN
jgi:hypothetical protein